MDLARVDLPYSLETSLMVKINRLQALDSSTPPLSELRGALAVQDVVERYSMLSKCLVRVKPTIKDVSHARLVKDH